MSYEINLNGEQEKIEILNRSGNFFTIFRAFSPMEPVDPSMESFFIGFMIVDCRLYIYLSYFPRYN